MYKSLVAYFSATGATKRLAQRIAKTLDADIFEIEPATKYTNEDLKWPSRNNRSCMEMKNKRFRPEMLNNIGSIEKYNRILGAFLTFCDPPLLLFSNRGGRNGIAVGK